MFSEATIRKTVWATVPFNFVGALTFGIPHSFPGRLLQMPPAPAIFTWNLGFLIALFGLAYAWIALQPRINRPLLTLGAIGKIGVFVVAAVLYSLGQVALLLVLAVAGDLLFGAIWLIWLRSDQPPKL
jgi:hypothetical protein